MKNNQTNFQDETLKVRLPHGYLVATVSQDPNYPGIDVEFLSDKNDGSKPSQPRVLVEMPFGEERDETSNIRVLIWADENNEDYSDKVEFENTSVREHGNRR